MVFVIDDDASVRKSLKRLFHSAGYESELFPSASEFLRSPARNIRVRLVYSG